LTGVEWLQVVWGSEGVPMPAPPPERSDVRIVTLEEVERRGARALRPHLPPRPSGIATISYTSGTTGVPKGVRTSPASIAASTRGCLICYTGTVAQPRGSCTRGSNRQTRANMVLSTRMQIWQHTRRQLLLQSILRL
jgi:acyl-CoA synthetase (AMP-forming)/AMP-acid ligase II